MSADLVPAEVLAPTPPLTDDDLERYGAWATTLAEAAELPLPVVAGDLDLLGPNDPNVPAPMRSWRIDGDRTAAWAMAKLAAATEEMHHVAELAAEYHRQIDQWATERTRRPVATAAYMDAQLCDYGLRVREASAGSIKSVPLPNGQVKTTASGAKPAVADEPAVLAWAKANLEGEVLTDVVRVTEHVSVTNWRDVVSLDTVVDEAKVVHANCACVVTYKRFPGLQFPPYEVLQDAAGGQPPLVLQDSPSVPQVGDGVCCPACGSDTLVGQVEVLASHQVVVDDTGNEVPGAQVEPAKVTAKAVPA